MQTLKEIIRSLETLVQDAETMTLKDIKSWVRRDLEDLKSLVDWFNGPDWHHVFFEGVYLDEDGVGEIYWGS